jgi:hypothetical protein
MEAIGRTTVFFADREPVGPYPITVPARRTLHQHTRLDSRQSENALLSTVACPGWAR